MDEITTRKLLRLYHGESDGSNDDNYAEDAAEVEESESDSDASELGAVEQIEHIKARISQLFGVEPKSGQVDALHRIVYGRKDLILIASTGFGKSLIFKAAPLIQLEKRQSILVILPLKAIEEEQHSSLATIEGASSIVLDGNSNTSANLRRIGAGQFTHGMFTHLNSTTSANVA
jgi:ATP-dependent helicase YprA (DUF1998 family)